MADILKVTSVIHPGGSIHADLTARAEETVSYIKHMPDACEECIANAESEEPRPPRLHPHCRCELVTTTVAEILNMDAG